MTVVREKSYKMMWKILVVLFFVTLSVGHNDVFDYGSLNELSVRYVVEGIKNRFFTCEEYVNETLSRHVALAYLNAFSQVTPTSVLLQKARSIDCKIRDDDSIGKLPCVLFSVKNSIDVVGFNTTSGTAALQGNAPTQNAPVVQNLLDEDAIVFGVNRLDEMSSGVTGQNFYPNPFAGFVMNPFGNATADPYISGGSSSGSAVAVAAWIVPLAIGEDTGGSIRVS
jgi:Asp-tRNA(Asn)/Glu-tRNA(Gln) amidotransferase A subunit family amidase